MKRKTVTTFLIPLFACAAFLIGSVQLWGTPANKLLSVFLMVVLMIVILALLAFGMIVIIKMLGALRKK